MKRGKTRNRKKGNAKICSSMSMQCNAIIRDDTMQNIAKYMMIASHQFSLHKFNFIFYDYFCVQWMNHRAFGYTKSSALTFKKNALTQLTPIAKSFSVNIYIPLCCALLQCLLSFCHRLRIRRIESFISFDTYWIDTPLRMPAASRR